MIEPRAAPIMASTERARRGADHHVGVTASAKSQAPPSKLGGGPRNGTEAVPSRAAHVTICGVCASATKKEVSCSPQQEASQVWLFRILVAHRPKTHSRSEGIGSPLPRP